MQVSKGKLKTQRLSVNTQSELHTSFPCSDFNMHVHAGSVTVISSGARVILACRDMVKGQQAARDITREVQGANVVARQLDLADTKSICQFAENICRSG